MTKEAIEQIRKYLAARATNKEFGRQIHALHDANEREAVLLEEDLKALLDALKRTETERDDALECAFSHRAGDWKERSITPPEGRIWASDGKHVWFINSDGGPIPASATSVKYWAEMFVPAAPLAKPDPMPALGNGDLLLALQEVTPEMIKAAEGIEDLYRRGTPNTWANVYRTMLKIALASVPRPAAANASMEADLLAALQAARADLWEINLQFSQGDPTKARRIASSLSDQVCAAIAKAEGGAA